MNQNVKTSKGGDGDGGGDGGGGGGGDGSRGEAEGEGGDGDEWCAWCELLLTLASVIPSKELPELLWLVDASVRLQ